MANQRRRTKRSSNKHDKAMKDSKYTDDKVKLNEPMHTNDPSWYFRDPVLKQGLTSMPTFEFRGTNIPLDITMDHNSSITTEMEVVKLKSPTIAAHYLNPSPGVSTSGTSAINMAARMMYSKLSSSNAKTSNYAPQDVSTLMLAIGEVVSLISHATRLYGITQFFNRMNRAIPEALLRAHGITDAATWTQNLPAFRANLNQLITVANSIAFPSNIPYFKKCSYVYQNVYIDDESEMTAYHIMMPYTTWTIDEDDYEQGTILKTSTEITGHNVTTHLRTIIDELLTSTTYNYIYSDILNLATRGVLGSDLLSFGTIPIDYVTEPILSDQFNWQIMNATICGIPNGTLVTEGVYNDLSTPNNDVYPSVDYNGLFYMPTWNSTGATWYTNYNYLEPIIRVQNVNISEDDLIENLVYTGTHKTHLKKVDSSIKSNTQAVSLPDHYVVKSKIFYGDPSITDNFVNLSHNSVTSTNTGLAMCGEFQHFPLLYAAFSDSTGSDGVHIPKDLRFFGRFGSYTRGIRTAINRMRDAAYMGLFTLE